MQHSCFPKLFRFRERSRNAGFSCYNVTLLPENDLPLDIKDLLKEDRRFFDGGWIDWLAAYEGPVAE
jgi:hypothetical protein